MTLSATSARAASRSPSAPPRPRTTNRLARWDHRFSPYLYIAPFFVIFAVFGAYPLAKTMWISLHDWDLINEPTLGSTWVGLDNYAALLSDPYFWRACRNTFGIFLLATIPQLTVALLLANTLNRVLRWRTFLRTSVLLPNATSVAAVAIVFGTLFQRDFGVINWFLGLVGVSPVDWHGSVLANWTAIAVMVDWRWTGYNALILLAAMQAIPRDLYESASIDGAGPARQFFSITLPMLRPAFLFVSVVSVIGGLQLYTEPVIFNNGSNLGGSLRESQTLVMYMFENSLDNTNKAGYGAAVAWALFLLILLAALANYLLVRKTVKS